MPFPKINDEHARGLIRNLDSTSLIAYTCPNCEREQVVFESLEDQDHLICRGCLTLIDFDRLTDLEIREQSPRWLEQYQLLRKIGQGSFGTVWQAFDPWLQRYVAIKMPHPERDAQDVRQSLMKEAKIYARLSHPNITPVYDFIETPETFGIVTEYIDGQCLDQWSRSKGNEDIVDILIDLADTVEYAHQMGLIHRDIKPSNVMIAIDPQSGKTKVKLLDFSIARISSQETLTQNGALMGTPAYMSPEQVQPEQSVTTSSDIYALGIVLYELLEGRLPFRESVPALLEQIVKNRAPAMSISSPDLETIVMKCLEKDPRLRYATARDLTEDLRSWRKLEPISARPLNAIQKALLWSKRNPPMALAVGGIIASLSVGMVATSVQWMQAQEQRQKAETNLKKTQNVIDGLLFKVAHEKMMRHHGLSSLQIDILEQAKHHYIDLLEEYPSNEIKLKLADVHMRLSSAYSNTKAENESDSLQDEKKLLDELLSKTPDNPRLLENLAHNMAHRATHAKDLKLIEAAIGIFKRLQKEFPEYSFQERSLHIHIDHAELLLRHQKHEEMNSAIDRALAFIREQDRIEIASYQVEFFIARALSLKASNLLVMRKYAEAMKLIDPMLKHSRDAVKNGQYLATNKMSLAYNLCMCASIALMNQKKDQAILLYREAITHLTAMKASDPEFMKNDQWLNVAKQNLAALTMAKHSQK